MAGKRCLKFKLFENSTVIAKDNFHSKTRVSRSEFRKFLDPSLESHQ
jgi:hypothetical protein